MNNVSMAFILTTLSGLSTMLGSIFVLFKNNNKNILISSLSFASGVMITVSFTDLIKESYILLKNIFPLFPRIIYILIFIITGIILSMIIDKYLPENHNTTDKNLYRVGMISMFAIILHNIPEGIATFMATNANTALGISLCIAIALHNIPEGISISIPIYYSTKSRGKALIYTFISGISEVFGALLTYLFLSNFINDRIMGFLFSLIAGIMIQISIYELIPTSLSYNNKKTTCIFFIIGVLFMLVNHFIF
jgi:ZIP family zinc transporter